MKIYDTEKEARDAAERVLSCFTSEMAKDCVVGNYDDKCCIRNGNTNVVVAEFKFKPERVAPEKGRAVMNQVGAISYSMGVIENGGLNAVYRTDQIGGSNGTHRVHDYTPVDIIPAGQFAKAVELLEHALRTRHDRLVVWPDAARKLLDEIKSGGE
jgi:hypothetical protein